MSVQENQSLIRAPLESSFPPIDDYGHHRRLPLGSPNFQTGIDRLALLAQIRFPFGFRTLLDRERGGSWRISLANSDLVTRVYVSDTNILETRFEAPSGTMILTDLMPVREKTSLVPDH